MKEYPKILILGQPFNKISGGGITISNLFTGWPKDKIAVAATGHLLFDASSEICDTYYQLGNAENKWIFPFSLIQKTFISGIISFDSKISFVANKKKTGFRRFFVDKLFFPFINWLGLFHCTSTLSLSQDLKNWLSVYLPEILYIQVASREGILFAGELIDYLRIPCAIHMMDDWPSTISSRGPFKNYWRKKIDKELKSLLDKINVHLCISHAMSDEYFKRYGKRFIAFHNPIDITKYKKVINNTENNKKTYRILYMGRIGLANKHSIYSFASAVSRYQVDQRRIYLDLFPNYIEPRFFRILEQMDNIKVLSPIKHTMVPELLQEYDFLLLPLDFTKDGLKFARYSMPTKASEYMISGTPIIIFAPKETAISQFCSQNECGFCINNPNQAQINEALHFLINNEGYRKKISQNAVRLATELFDSKKVRKEFQQLLINLTNIKN